MIGRSLNAGCSSFRADAGLIVRSSPTSATVMDSSLPALSVHLDHRRTCQVPSRTEGVVSTSASREGARKEPASCRYDGRILSAPPYRLGALSNFREGSDRRSFRHFN